MLLVRYRTLLKGQNTGGALAVSKALEGQIERIVKKFPTTFYVKNALNSHADPIYNQSKTVKGLYWTVTCQFHKDEKYCMPELYVVGY